MKKKTPGNKTRAKRETEAQVLRRAKIEANERDSKHGIGGKCLPCMLQIPLRNGDVGQRERHDYNHCIPRSLLPGRANWHILHSAQNLAPTCQAHHIDWDRQPRFWLRLMALKFGYDYRQPPWSDFIHKSFPSEVIPPNW